MFLYLRNITLLLFVQLSVEGQSFKYHHYTTDEGLPNNNVYASAQTEDGCIWFATDLGISKFDGYRFKNYYKRNGIAAKAITDIIYAGGDSCVFIAYPNTLQSIHSNGTINTLFVEKEYSLEQLIKHGSELFFYQRNKPAIRKWSSGKVFDIVMDDLTKQKGTILRSIASLGNKGVAYCTNKGLYIQQANDVSVLLPNQDIYFVLLRKNGTLVVATDKSIEESSGDFEFNNSISIKGNEFIYNMVEDGSETIWMRGMEKGVYQLTKNQLIEISATLNLQNQAVNEFFVDKQNNVWLCTNGNGVVCKSSSTAQNYLTQDGLINNHVTQIQKIRTSYFIGTANGMSKLENEVMRPIPLPSSKVGLQYVNKLFTVNNELGISINNTFRPDTSHSNKIQKMKMGGLDFYFEDAMAIWKENENIYWIAGKNSVAKVNNHKIVEQFDLNPLGIRRPYDIIKYNGLLYVGTSDGIVTIKNNAVSAIKTILNEPIGEVMQFLIDKKNRLWMATENGLFYFQNNQYNKVPMGATLESNYCKSITMDKDGMIWCATWDGFFSTDGLNRRNFNSNVGIASKTCNTIVYDSTDNKLLIGTDRGLSILGLTQIVNKVAANKVIIESKYKDSVYIRNNATLKSNQTSLDFYFNIPHFEKEARVQYQYMLDGKEWVTVNNPYVNLTNIGGGKHQLLVRALLNGEVVSKENTEFVFTIKQKFYKTWWFLLLSAALLQYIIYRIIKYRNIKTTNRKLAEKTQQVEYASLKQQAFASLMNPHFIFNALNSVQHFVNKQDRLNANRYLSDFAKLIRRSFDSAQQSFVPLEEELETIRLYIQLELMRFNNKFEYAIHIDEQVNEDDWVLPSMVLQPYIENAILHGLMPLSSKGSLYIHITEVNKKLTITIKDNGIGMEQSKTLKANSNHKSKGMHLIKERLDILGKLCGEPIELTVSDAYPDELHKGTMITLVIPNALYTVYLNTRQVLQNMPR